MGSNPVSEFVEDEVIKPTKKATGDVGDFFQDTRDFVRDLPNVLDKPEAPKPLGPPTTEDNANDPQAVDVREQQRKRAAAAQGRRSTILTGNAGDESSATSAGKRLLGE